jgi:hypothetical protein
VQAGTPLRTYAGTIVAKCSKLRFDSLLTVQASIRDGLAYDAKVTWNGGVAAGVSFQKAFRLSKIVDWALGHLKDLWLAHAAQG